MEREIIRGVQQKGLSMKRESRSTYKTKVKTRAAAVKKRAS